MNETATNIVGATRRWQSRRRAHGWWEASHAHAASAARGRRHGCGGRSRAPGGVAARRVPTIAAARRRDGGAHVRSTKGRGEAVGNNSTLVTRFFFCPGRAARSSFYGAPSPRGCHPRSPPAVVAVVVAVVVVVVVAVVVSRLLVARCTPGVSSSSRGRRVVVLCGRATPASACCARLLGRPLPRRSFGRFVATPPCRRQLRAHQTIAVRLGEAAAVPLAARAARVSQRRRWLRHVDSPRCARVPAQSHHGRRWSRSRGELAVPARGVSAGGFCGRRQRG